MGAQSKGIRFYSIGTRTTRYIGSTESLPTQNFARKVPFEFSSICLHFYINKMLFFISTIIVLLKAQKCLPHMSMPANAVAILKDIMYRAVRVTQNRSKARISGINTDTNQGLIEGITCPSWFLSVGSAPWASKRAHSWVLRNKGGFS